jgi:hypothetical protein
VTDAPIKVSSVFGVSVFEFKMPQTENSEAYEGRERPRFIGYGHIPVLNE